MKLIQEKVKNFCEEHKLESPPEHGVLDTMSELGEVAKEILKMSDYGKKPIELGREIKAEMGDVFYSLVNLANSLEIDLEEALEIALQKYSKRLEKGSPGSEND